MDIHSISSKKYCANFFIHEIIWYDPDWNTENTELTKIRMTCDNVIIYKDLNKCLAHLQDAENSIQLIFSGASIDKILALSVTILKIKIKSVSNIYVYNCKVENAMKSLLSNYKIFNFIQNFDDLLSAIRKEILKVEFPKLKQYDEFTDHDYYELGGWEETLNQFVNFAKIKLCSNKDYQIYPEHKIQSFSKDNSEYSDRKLLSWYANDFYLRKLLNVWRNNDFIIKNLKLWFIRPRLYNVVKDLSKNQKIKYSGVLYSETMIDDDKWEALQKKVGMDIVIDSFLPASKNRDQFVPFNIQDTVFITIILPGFHGKWENDFIDLTQFSHDCNRQEILFNSLTEFRVLEAKIQGLERHLVLLYEVNTLRKFMKLNQTALSFVKNPLDLKCNVCGFDISNNALVFFQLLSFENICENCLVKYQSLNKCPLLRTTPSNLKNEKSFEGHSYVEIQGILLKYDKLDKLPFYGYQCVKCKGTGSNYYTCLKCPPPSSSRDKESYFRDPFEYGFNCLKYPKTIARICEACASQTCFKENHPLILENYPYTFWSETISEKEYHDLKVFQKRNSDNISFNSNEEWEDCDDDDEENDDEEIVDEEIDMKDSMDKIVRLLVLEAVWYEPDCKKKVEDLKKNLGNFANKINITFFNEANEALDYLRKVDRFVQVIVSGNNFEQFVQDALKIKNVSYIHIPGEKPKGSICDKFSFYKNDEALIGRVKRSTRRVEFPMFCLLSDSHDRMKINKMHGYLKCIKFKNDEKPRQDLINLARNIYFQSDTHAKDIKSFEETYQAQGEETLYWYTKNTFLYELVNNCLRLATFESVQLCKYFLHYLNNAIKERYLTQDRNYNGILFRASFISNDEWELLENNIGKDMEMFGFLSTTKDINVAAKFGATTGRALITIIVPPIFEKGNQGFADLEKFSAFQEREILFNINSRFTVLEAIKDDSFRGRKFPRHVVLLYASEELRMSATLVHKVFEINIIKKELIQCRFCNAQLDQNLNCLFHASLDLGSHENNSYICNNCIAKYKNFHTAPLLCINPSICDSTVKVKGFPMKYTQNLEIPFYGYRCSECSQKNLNVEFYKCLDCEGLCCGRCFLNDYSCLKNKHLIVLETQPYSFWTKKMMQSQISQYEVAHQRNFSHNKFFPIAQMLFDNSEYEKCLECYNEYLGKIDRSVYNTKNAMLYKGLAETYMSLRRLREAENWCLESKKTLKKMDEDDFDTEEFYLLQKVNLVLADIKYKSEKYEDAIKICFELIANPDQCIVALEAYEMIGLAYQKLGNLKEALKYHLKCVEGDPETCLIAAPHYNNLGSTYHEMGDYQAAMSNHIKFLDLCTSFYGEEHSQTALAYENIGHNFHMLGDYGNAMLSHLKALTIKNSVYEETDKDLNILLSCENIGLVSLCSKEYDKAIEYFTKSLQILLHYGEQDFMLAKAYGYLGIAYNGKGKYQEAFKNLFKSLELLKSVLVGNDLAIPNLFNKIRLAFSGSKVHEKTLRLCMESTEIKSESNESGEFSEDCYILLGQVFMFGLGYLGLGEYEKAKENLSLALDIMTVNVKDTAQVASLETLLNAINKK